MKRLSFALGILLVFLVVTTGSLAWAYNGWQYRKPITISNPNSNTLTNFQVKLTIDTASLISAGKMNSDCSDMRFTDDNDTALPYWIQSGCNSQNTIVWVKVPSIPASGQAMIYMYYGNSGATSESNGDSVFEFFDDFNGDSLDTSKWEIHRWYGSGTYSVTVKDGELEIQSGSATDAGVVTTQSFNLPIVERVRYKMVSGAEVWNAITETQGGSASNWVRHGYTNAPTYFYQKNTGSISTYTSSNRNAPSEFVNADIVWTYSNSYYYENGNQINTVTTQDGYTSGRVYLEEFTYNGGAMDIDYIFVRKYADSDPTASVGEEETAGHTILLSHTPAYPLAGDTITLNVTFPSNDMPTSCTIDWNDSTSDTIDSPQETNLINHTYSASGAHVVNVTCSYTQAPDTSYTTHLVGVWGYGFLNKTWTDKNFDHRFYMWVRNNNGNEYTGWANFTLNTTSLINQGYLDANCTGIMVADSSGRELPTEITGCGGEQTVYFKATVGDYLIGGFYVYLSNNYTYANTTTGETVDKLQVLNVSSTIEKPEIETFTLKDISNILQVFHPDEATPTENYEYNETKRGGCTTGSASVVFRVPDNMYPQKNISFEWGGTLSKESDTNLAICPSTSYKGCVFVSSNLTGHFKFVTYPTNSESWLYVNGSLVTHNINPGSMGTRGLTLYPQSSNNKICWKGDVVYAVGNTTDTPSVQNFCVTINGHTECTTDGQVAWNTTAYPFTDGDIANITAGGYASRTFRVKTGFSQVFYTDKDTFPVLHMDVRTSATQPAEANKTVDVSFNYYPLGVYESNATGFVNVIGNPLRTYTLEWDGKNTTWSLEYLIQPVLDERTGSELSATGEQVTITLLNDTMSKTWTNTSSITITRSDIFDHSIPEGDVTVIVGAKDYASRMYYLYLGGGKVSLQPRLLKYSDGVWARFTVQNQYGNTMPNALIDFRRLYGSTYQTVTQVKTDSSGQAQVLLDPYNTYKIHVLSSSGIYDGKITPQAGSYTVVVGNKTFNFQTKQGVQVRITPLKPKVGDVIHVDIYDPYGALQQYNVTIQDTQGHTIYTYTGNQPEGETIVINTSTLPTPSNPFAYWKVHVSWERKSTFDPGFTTNIYFTSSNSVGLDYTLQLGNMALPGNVRMFVAVVALFVLAGAVAVYVSPTVAVFVLVVMGIVFAVYGWLPMIAVLLAAVVAFLYRKWGGA